MTDIVKQKIIAMRGNGESYNAIAETLGLSKSTVQSVCRRSQIQETENQAYIAADAYDSSKCRCCKKPLKQQAGVRRRYFCSKECRISWWRQHPEKSGGKPGRVVTCPGCGKKFTVHWNKSRKYCSHECYVRTRFKGGADGE